MLSHILGEVGGQDLVRPLGRGQEGMVHGLLVLLLGDEALLEHPPQHAVPLGEHHLRHAVGAVPAGEREDARERRGLGQRELRSRLVEVVARGGLHPVVAVPQVHQVQVHGEDLLLAVVLLELDRQERLLDLPLPHLVAGEEEAPGELHADRGGALDHLAGADVHVRGAEDAHGVDAAVLEEIGILRGEHRLLHQEGDLPLLEHHPPLGGIGRKDAPVPRIEVGHQARRVGQAVHPGHVDGGGHAHPHDRAHHQGGEDRPGPAQDSLGTPAGGCMGVCGAVGRHRLVLHGPAL
jgi:hypothetical protein